MSSEQNIQMSFGIFLVDFTRFPVYSIINMYVKHCIMHNYLSDCAMDRGKMSKKYYNISSFMDISAIYSFQVIFKT